MLKVSFVFHIVDCGNLPDPANGQITLTGTVIGSMATYSCDRGYLPSSDPILRCQDDGDWSGFPLCLSMLESNCQCLKLVLYSI